MGGLLATSELTTPIGGLRLAATRKGLVRVALAHGAGTSFAGWLRRVLPDAELVPSLSPLEQALDELQAYFDRRLREFKTPLDLRGTPFQLAVWQALLQIPYGATRSYADIARSVGRPTAYRAVGLANGANPVPIIVPCHRVISADGTLGGYGGGAETKRRLLAFEQNEAHQNRLL